MSTHLRSAALSCLAPLLAAATAHAAGDLNATARCVGSNQVEIRWEWIENPADPPVLRPEWVGYDLYRRGVAGCSPWERVNADVIPRVPGGSHAGVIPDVLPALLVTYEYRLVPVDAARQEIVMLWPECEPPCPPRTWESCPTLGAPVTVGTVEDWGWAVYVHPCSDGCWSGFYVAEPTASLLRPHAGTGQVLRLFGHDSCGSVEGCALEVTSFEPGGCGPTPAGRPSWGRVKTNYR